MKRFCFRYIFCSFLALLSLTLLACGDDAGSGNKAGDPTDITIDNPKPKEGYTMVLVPFMEREMTINREGSIKLKVALFSTATGEGVSGEDIVWTFKTGEDILSASMKSTVTDNEGYTSVLLKANGAMGDVEIIASHPKVPKNVLFTIHVIDLPSGNLYVQSTYSGAAPVKNYSIRLYDYEELDCSKFDPAYPVADEPIVKVDAQDALFEHLLVDQQFSILVYGFGENGAPVASGCVDSNVRTRENETVNISVSLETIRLNPVTVYHVRSYFNFNNVIENLGETGKWLATILNGVDNPGALMYKVLVDDLLLGTACQFFLSELICSGADWLMGTFGLKGKLEAYLNDLVVQSDTGCKIINFACQLRAIVQTLELMGDLNIQRIGSGFTFSGTNSYKGLAVYWRVNCDGNPDPNCGRHALTTDLADDVNLIEGSWTGGVSNGYDKLSIDRHAINLYYGKLIVFIVENFLLPRVANGATNFSDALANWFNCNGIANWLHQNIKLPTWLGGAGVSLEQGQSWCRSAINLIDSGLGFVKTFTNLQNQRSLMMISGSGRFVDKSGDNVVDHIDEGKWNGDITMEGKTTMVSGFWSAYNKNNSQYCSYPKTSTDTKDQLCAYPPIDISSILESNLCGKCKGQSF